MKHKPGLKKRRLSGYSSHRYKGARKDWDVLLSSARVLRKTRTVRRSVDGSIKEALKLIFRGDTIQLLSWGTKRIKVGGQWKYFPAVLRKLSA